MPTLASTVDGLNLPNPFIIGSGPPGTNMRVIEKAFDLGWGGVIAKTISLEADKVHNVQPRYAMKACSATRVLREMREHGVWIDAVSGNEGDERCQ